MYVGYDDPDSLGKDETGGHVAAPIFRDFMIAALKDAPATEFRIPPGMRLYRVNPAHRPARRLGDGPAIYEAYKPGTEPGNNRDSVPSTARPAEADGVPVASTGDGEGMALPVRGAPASGTGGLY